MSDGAEEGNAQQNNTPVSRLDTLIESHANSAGNLLVNLFHYMALFAIGAATVWAAAHAFLGMVEAGRATVQDLLLLFIYLEIGAMVGIYFKTNHMPVRFLIYVAITAITRLLIDLVNVEHRADIEIVYLSGSILLLAVAVLVIRFGSYRFPARTGVDMPTDAVD